MNFWKRLLAFLHLGVEGDDDPPPDDALDGLDDAPAGDPDPDPPTQTDPPVESASEKRARELEVELAAERATNRTLRERQPAPSNRESDTDRDARELAEARARGATENDVGWLKFRQDTARESREARNEAAAARREASDMADKADFNSIAAAKPQAFKVYGPKVEAAIAEMRASGQAVPPRRVVMALLIGKDALDGKLKQKAPKAGEPAPPTRVDRGRMPGVRTDVSSRGARKTDHQSRIERLRDKAI